MTEEMAIKKIRQLETRVQNLRRTLLKDHSCVPAFDIEKCEQICRTVASEFGFSQAQIESRARTAPVAIVRQVAMTITRQATTLSQAQVGKYFGRDHGTVSHAEHAVKDRMDTEPAFKQRVEKLMEKLKGMIQ